MAAGLDGAAVMGSGEIVMSVNSNALRFFKSGILFLIVGMSAGVFMAASHDHTIAPAHAHLNLLGFVVSCVYGTFYGLFPDKGHGWMPRAVWGVHTLSIAVMAPALAWMLYGNPEVEPFLAGASILLVIAAVLFAVTVFRPVRVARAHIPEAPLGFNPAE